jgi:hypothetical protein
MRTQYTGCDGPGHQSDVQAAMMKMYDNAVHEDEMMGKYYADIDVADDENV